MRELRTVIAFTFKNKFRSKSFIITSVIFALLITVGIHLPFIISLFASEDPDKIGMFPSPLAHELKTYYEEAEDPALEIVLLEEPDTNVTDQWLEQLFEKEKVKAFLEVMESEGGVFPELTYYSEESLLDTGTRSEVQDGMERLKQRLAIQQLELEEAELNLLFAPVEMEVKQITDDEKSSGELAIAYILVYALLIMIFMTVTMYGNLIAAEITAEKSSRVMEILISSVSPLKQMFGKIIGVCALGLVQIAVFVAIALANISLPHNREQIADLELNLADLPFDLLFYFVLFYILAYFLYATIFAAIGSLISRTEDLGQALTPVTVTTLAGFYIAIFGLNAPDAPFVAVTSFIPFFTPMIMFLRIGLGDPALWEVLLSLVLLAAAIWIMGWLAAKIYRVGVLMYGKRPTFKEIMKAMKAYKV